MIPNYIFFVIKQTKKYSILVINVGQGYEGGVDTFVVDDSYLHGGGYSWVFVHKLTDVYNKNLYDKLKGTKGGL